MPMPGTARKAAKVAYKSHSMYPPSDEEEVQEEDPEDDYNIGQPDLIAYFAQAKNLQRFGTTQKKCWEFQKCIYAYKTQVDHRR